MDKRVYYHETVRIFITAILSAILIIIALGFISVPAFAAETTYDDDSKKNLDDTSVTYRIVGGGKERVNGNYFTVPKNKSSESEPIVIILDNVNRSQVDKSPDKSFITIEEGNYVIIKLRGKNIIRAGENKQLGSNDGMAALHVAKGSTMKVTSEEGDGSEAGSLEAYGGGGKYGGAGIGTRYNDDTGTIIIAGGTIKATGGHSASGIGSGRDGAAKKILITGGNITAQGGDYGAGIGAGDNVDTGKGGDLYDLSITGGTVNATGGKSGAGIGGSEGGSVRGQILISGGTVTAQGGNQASGIGCGEGGGLSTDDGEKGSILITGGSITATGGSDGAGIGGGDHSDHLKVTIDQNSGTALNITANGGKYGAGIGMGDGEADLVDITLRGGTINAQGGEHGAGIGAGDSIDKINISGSGTITAKGGSGAAGIGAGYDHEVNDSINIQGDSSGKGDRRLTITADGAGVAAGIGSGSEDCGPIKISNATVTAFGDGNAADIGTGGNFGNGGTISSIEIENCRIDTKGQNKYGAGIGAGAGCECKKISIKDSECYGNSIGGGMGVFFLFWENLGDMESIDIENSTIEATWDRVGGSENMKGSSAAGIGTSTLGCIKEINIKNSTVTAKGINGGAGIGTGGWGADNFMGLEYVGGEAGNITIENSTVTATGAEPGITTNSTSGPDLTKRPVIGGGAGIGGGGNTNCQVISIDNSNVTAKAGKYAAGIGGGGSESIDSVSITNSTVSATGGVYGAGIGCGGSDNATTATVFHADVDTICIDNSEVSAQGGDYAAGIGAGCGAAMDTTTSDNQAIENNIDIKDSKVTSTGGKGGAGIGGGMVGAYSRGGHSGNILLEGKSQITASGGRQGSGVGGGAASDFQGHGGADKIVIDLTDCADTAKGPEAIGDNGGWLIAEGGKGAAGIGAGGYLFHKGKLDPIPNTNDTEYVEILGGYVKAAGGADDTDDSGVNTGSGAGIGGGAAGTRLKNLVVSGGWIEASSGGEHAADIGHGGNADGETDGTDHPSNNYYVADGTVIADNIGSKATKVIDGGSFKANLSDAQNSAGTPVYQTKLKMLSSKKERVNIKPDQYSYYGTDSIYADEGGYVYLYLPVSEEMKQTAEVTEPADYGNPESRQYYGTTNDQGTGWLKMEGEQLNFKVRDPENATYNNVFTLELDDEQIASGTEWSNVSVEGTAYFISPWNLTSPGMYLTLQASGVGKYTVYAESQNGEENELYWNDHLRASFTGEVAKAVPELVFTEDPDKTYDGTPVNDPSAVSESQGKVTYTYYDDKGNLLSSAPTDAGSYEVVAHTEETDLYTDREIRQGFSITPAPTSVALTLGEDGASATATAEIAGLYEPDGKVTFKVNGTELITSDVVQLGSGNYGAAISSEFVESGEYTVEAEYKPSTGNYQESRADASGKKDLASRSISGGTAHTKTFGDSSFNLGLSASPNTANDVWTYEIIWDSFSSRYGGTEPCVTVDQSGEVSINHAGTAIIKATLSDGLSAYNDTSAFITVEVSPLKLTAISYAHRGDDNPQAADYTKTYGMLQEISSDLIFTDGPDLYAWDDIKNGFIGTLSASPIPETLGAGEHKIPILRNGADVTVGGDTRSIFYSRDYEIEYKPGVLNVEKRRLAIKANDASGIYGGDEPSFTWDVIKDQDLYQCNGLATWDVKDSVFKTDPTVTLDADKTYKNLAAGTYPGSIVVSGGESDNYAIEYINGNLDIYPAAISDAERFTVSADDAVYNGRDNKVPVHITDNATGQELVQGEDKDVTVSYTGDTTNAGTVRVVIKGIGNYTGHLVASYDIKRARITVNTQSARKDYDGTELTAPGAAVGIIGDDAVFSVNGSQTEAGQTENSYDLVFKDNTAKNNYIVEAITGVLKVDPFDIGQCRMTDPDDVVYDGKEHVPEITLEDGNGKTLKEGKDYRLLYKSKTENFSDAGPVFIIAIGLNNYRGVKPVSFEIKPVQITVSTESAEKEYDGKPLTAPGKIDGLLDGETAEIKTTGSITETGSVENYYKLIWDGTAKENNYKVISEYIGTLTVKEYSKEITVTTAGGTFTYDGKPHAAKVEVSELPEGYTLEAASSAASATNATKEPVSATADTLVIKNASGDDVTDRLKIKKFDGTIVIKPAPLTVTTQSAEKIYDGTALTAEGSMSGLVNDETASFKTTGSQTAAGSSKNTYSISWDGTAKESNYSVESETLGTLTVTELPEAIKYSCVKGDESSWTKGSKTPLAFTFKRSVDDKTTFDHFTGVRIDGKVLEKNAYEAEPGSVVISLNSKYLDELDAGKHSIQALFDDGTSNEAVFTVIAQQDDITEPVTPDTPDTDSDTGDDHVNGNNADVNKPDTGDDNQLALWVIIMIFSAVSLAGCVLTKMCFREERNKK